MNKKRVLVIDDDKDVCDVISLLLQKTGFETLTAANGQEGINLAGTQQPNLILLDIMLPDINGFEVLNNLRQNTKTHNIPIIMVSGRRDSDSIIKARHMKSSDYIMKPFSSQELLKIVGKYLGLINYAQKKINIEQIRKKLDSIRDVLNRLRNNEYIPEEFKEKALKELDETKDLLPKE